MSYRAERLLAYFYPFIIVTTLVCCITSAIAFTHWQYVLNACPETSPCSCYLNARSVYGAFEGGAAAYCHFATYGLLIPLIIATVLGIYHVYRICMDKAGKRKSGTTTIRQRSGDMIVVTTESELSNDAISPYYWIPAGVISSVMAVYCLVYASIFTDGFGTTCHQYRETLLKEIQGVGNIVPVIKGRLACSAIFDFMDYLVESSDYNRRKYGRINTSICLHLTLISAWIAVVIWILISVVNLVQSRRTRAARV